MEEMTITITIKNGNGFKQARWQILEQCFLKLKTRKEVSKFLGLSVRGIQYIVTANKELHKYKNRHIIQSGNEFWDDYEDTKLWKTKKLT